MQKLQRPSLTCRPGRFLPLLSDVIGPIMHEEVQLRNQVAPLALIVLLTMPITNRFARYDGPPLTIPSRRNSHSHTRRAQRQPQRSSPDFPRVLHTMRPPWAPLMKFGHTSTTTRLNTELTRQRLAYRTPRIRVSLQCHHSLLQHTTMASRL